jgi:mRNA interferase MazF
MNRGDVVIVDFPFTSGTQGKLRPALVVQSDHQNRRLTKTIVAMITGNLRRTAEPTHLLIDPATPEGASSKLHGPSLVSCINLYTIDQASAVRTIGTLAPGLMHRVDRCLAAALGLAVPSTGTPKAF